MLIDLAGIDNNGQYCVSYGNNNEDEDSFENGPVCGNSVVPSCSLTSNLSSITAGGSVILTWVATDATTVTLSGPGISGAQTVTPPNGGTITMTPPSNITSATYTLNATGPGGACAASNVTITLLPVDQNNDDEYVVDEEYLPEGVEEEESIVPGVGKTGIAGDTPKAVTLATAGTGAILVIMKTGLWLLRKR